MIYWYSIVCCKQLGEIVMSCTSAHICVEQVCDFGFAEVLWDTMMTDEFGREKGSPLYMVGSRPRHNMICKDASELIIDIGHVRSRFSPTV